MVRYKRILRRRGAVRLFARRVLNQRRLAELGPLVRELSPPTWTHANDWSADPWAVFREWNGLPTAPFSLCRPTSGSC